MSVVQAPIYAFSAENFEKFVMQLAEVSGAKLLGYSHSQRINGSSFELDTVVTDLEVAACGFQRKYFWLDTYNSLNDSSIWPKSVGKIEEI